MNYFTPKVVALLLICCSLVFYAGGEYYSKVWSLRPSWSVAMLVTLLYAIGAVLWLPALREHGQLSALSAVWSCLSIVICVIIGVWCFGEELNVRQMIGLFLALVASVLAF